MTKNTYAATRWYIVSKPPQSILLADRAAAVGLKGGWLNDGTIQTGMLAEWDSENEQAAVLSTVQLGEDKDGEVGSHVRWYDWRGGFTLVTGRERRYLLYGNELRPSGYL